MYCFENPSHVYSKSSVFSSRLPLPSVVYPGPRGHIFLYCVVPGRGQSSQLVPQPLPPSQQHSDLVTKFLLLDVIWHRVVRTSVKQKPSRLSGGWEKNMRGETHMKKRGPERSRQATQTGPGLREPDVKQITHAVFITAVCKEGDSHETTELQNLPGVFLTDFRTSSLSRRIYLD